jgi:hypothetical protein
VVSGHQPDHLQHGGDRGDPALSKLAVYVQHRLARGRKTAALTPPQEAIVLSEEMAAGGRTAV